MLLIILTVRKCYNILRKRIAKNKSKEFEIDKAIKKKGNRLYVKWRGYNNSFNSCIDKKIV